MLIRFLGLVFGLEKAIVCARLNNNIWPGGHVAFDICIDGLITGELIGGSSLPGVSQQPPEPGAGDVTVVTNTAPLHTSSRS